MSRFKYNIAEQVTMRARGAYLCFMLIGVTTGSVDCRQVHIMSGSGRVTYVQEKLTDAVRSES